MQCELWARKKPGYETNSSSFEKICEFQDEKESYYIIDLLDSNIYSEAIVLKTDWQVEPSVVIYKDFRELEKRRIKTR